MPTKAHDEILQNIVEDHADFDVTNAFHVFHSSKPCSLRTQVAALVVAKGCCQRLLPKANIVSRNCL